MTDELEKTMLTIKLKEMITWANLQTERLDKAIEAVRFYADKNNWQYSTYNISARISNDDLGIDGGMAPGYETWEHGGARARAVLKEIEPVGGWTATVKLELE